MGERIEVMNEGGTLNAALLAGPGNDLPVGRSGRVRVKGMPMLHEADAARLSGDRVLSLRVAFAQAAHCTVEFDMCPRWRRRRKARLLDEALHRWLVARTIRDSLREDGR